MEKQIDKVLDTYKPLYTIPSLVSARIVSEIKNKITIQCVWFQKNLERLKKQKFIHEFIFDSNLELIAQNFPIEITSELMICISEDEKLKAILREVTIDMKPKQFIEIWNKQHLLKSYDLSLYDIHENVYDDFNFSSFNFSLDNKQLLYIAEKKIPKQESYYEQKCELKIKNKELKNEVEPSRGTKYIYRPDWGEQLTGKHYSTVIILTIDDDTILPIKSIPDKYFPVQVIWTPDNDGIVGVAYKLKSRYLGLYACSNRESCIFHLKGNEFRKLTTDGVSCSTPQFSPDGNNLIWLERDVSAPHHHVHRLMHLKWNNVDDTPKILIDVVKKYTVIADDKQFYGLYNHGLPQRCWSSDSKYIFLSTPQRSNIKSYIIHLKSKSIFEIDNIDHSSLTAIDVKNNFVIFQKFSLIQPSQLLIAKFNSSTQNIGKLDFINVTNSLKIKNFKNIIYEYTEFVYNTIEHVKDFNFTYFGTKNAESQSIPLIVALHGGPHSSYCNMFHTNYALMVSLGFGVLLINYRGSIGLGGDNIDYLLGKIGDVDVKDCIKAIDLALEKYPWIDSKKISLYGGSHGGFLSAHLSAQYPDKFRSVVMMNPVIDIVAMFTTTDIPDWCYAESGCSVFKEFPDSDENYSEILLKMLKHSPILYVNKVKAPTLIALGLKDLRVPASQGKLWYNRLLSNNVITKLFIYDDNHSLRKDDVEIDSVINAALWILEHNEK